jgi:two-component system response regulator AlgR
VNILITDDESLARQRLMRLLDNCGDFELHEAETGIEAVEKCHQQAIDLVFLDIRMPDMDGLEAAWHLAQMDTPPAVIFVTAYDDYALQAFSVNAIDYLLKPVKQEQLQQALNKASRLNRVQLNKVVEEIPNKPKRQHISAQLRGEIKLVPINEILFFQADQKYVNVHHKGGEVLIEEPLKQLEQELGDRFIRIHRNALVNKQYITGLIKTSEGHLQLTLRHTEQTLEVSRRHAPEVRKLVKAL